MSVWKGRKIYWNFFEKTHIMLYHFNLYRKVSLVWVRGNPCNILSNCKIAIACYPMNYERSLNKLSAVKSRSFPGSLLFLQRTKERPWRPWERCCTALTWLHGWHHSVVYRWEQCVMINCCNRRLLRWICEFSGQSRCNKAIKINYKRENK